MTENILTVAKYLENRTFVIPNYQRGYKWGVKPKNGKSSVEFFCESIQDAFNGHAKEYFIEAVTVVEENGYIVLVDGQQRTTTLYLILIALDEFDFLNSVILDYRVRKDSDRYLKDLLLNKGLVIQNEDIQDISIFNEALDAIKTILGSNIENAEFKKFLKEKVKLLYNLIPAEKAVNTFIALNGLKAVMKDEELIKSDILIKSSRTINSEEHNEKIKFGLEWKINEDRGRLARNWDKWLYWWNQKDVREYYGTGNKHPLYFLLLTYWNINKKDIAKKDFDFDNFKNQFISNSKDAKNHFEGLRKLQKTVEDLYNNYLTYNYLGIILKTSNSKDKEDALHYFLKNKVNVETLRQYAIYSLVGATHLEIVNNTPEKDDEKVIIKERKAREAIELLNSKYVYWNETDEEFKDNRKEYAFGFLLLLNLLEDNKLRRKFHFKIWSNRSLEHIYPKSKKENLDFDKFENQEGSIHCIGNLVLLYKNENSAFGPKDFDDKKSLYFDTSTDFNSRNLLHTISVFSNRDWSEKEIIENKKKTIQIINNQYELK